jgi:two-component system, NtrC family, nitrogen regulation response regulator NtrX
MNDLTSPPTVLVLDDEKNIRRAIEIALEQEGIRVVAAHDPAAALRYLRERIIDLLILDIKLGEIDGLGFFGMLRSAGFEVPTLFISGNATLTQAAEAVKVGAFDFIEKPFSAERIVIAVKRCLEFSTLKERLRLSEASQGSAEIIGDSQAIRKVIASALKVARTGASVLITGESGTGKELVANTIHAHSDRRERPFIKVNCSAIPETLIESELFGYVKGAFTGAGANKRGLFEVANRGTLFLDEVADLSSGAQAKILRVVQSGEMQKVGSEEATIVDVRVLSGTHKDLKELVSRGLFREDLYYRLNVLPIRVPSLRERADDVPLLAQFFAHRACEKNNVKNKPIDEDVLLELKRHQWPGNVRELQNVMERMIALSGERVSMVDIPEEIVAVNDLAGNRHSGSALREFRDNAERDFILGTLRRHLGNISQSAIELGVGRSYLHRRLAVLGISKKDWLS